MSWYSGTSQIAQNIENWFSVDIGYSEKSKSCGVYISSLQRGEDVSYDEMVKKFQNFLLSNKSQKVGLIIEAPLSIAFNNGNPIGRKKVEKENSLTRYWYNGAGATVT